MNSGNIDYETMRLIARVLTLHFKEGQLQSQVADKLGLSTAKVNRLIKRGRELGMVQITINSPLQRLFDLEQRFAEKWDLKKCLIVPVVTGSAETTLNQVGRGAAQLLEETINKGDTIAISGGRTLSALIDNLDPQRKYDVTVVPMHGGVQGEHYHDVNHIATQLADRLSGAAKLIHAPLHAESVEERDLVMSVKSVHEVMDVARNAAVALVGIGAVMGSRSTFYETRNVSEAERQKLFEDGVRGEILGHLIEQDGTLSGNDYNSRLVAIAPDEATQIPVTIGVASGPHKVSSIIAALNGGYVNSLVTDERTAQSVLEMEI